MIPELWFQNIYNMSNREIKENFKYLGEGISRIVYAIDDNYVIKLSKGIEGKYQSNVEKHIYNNVNDYFKTYLCPIVWFKPGMMVMLRAKPLKNHIHHRKVDLSKIITDRDCKSDMKMMADTFGLLYADIKAKSSWGILEGRPVLVDYGCTRSFNIKYLI